MKVIRSLEHFSPQPHTVVAFGNFDGVHLGHCAILKTAVEHARLGGGSAFALTFDPPPAKVLAPEHAPKLIVTPGDKLELLRHLGLDGAIVVSFTLALSRLTPRQFVRDYLLGRIGMREVVVGHSVSFGHQRTGNAAVMTRLGRELGFGATVVGPVNVEGIEVSSTKVRELISCGYLRGAARLLGRRHFLNGKVVRGRERGREIGFPTANLESETECIPPDGVYATRAVVDDGAHPSITNIGMRPTFSETQRSIETHIFEFNRNLYGSRLKLELVERIRGERKFESADGLRTQIARDLNRAREILEAA